jgi:Cdc6-like AAA superfamily ATPase
MSNLFLIIGHTGQGKTTQAKYILKNTAKKEYIFDVNNEYEGYNRETNGDFNTFLSNCFNLTDSNCVFEEATGYLTGRTGALMKKLIINKRHTRNNYIFLFHSIADVPPFIFRLSNFIILLKTGDEREIVKGKFIKLYKPFLELQSMPKYSKKIIKTI